MITLQAYQVELISKKTSKIGQCEWFRKTYGCTMRIQGSRYYLEFNTPQEETFFLLKYSNEITQEKPKDVMDHLRTLLGDWTFDAND